MDTRSIRIAVLCGLLLLAGGISRLGSRDRVVSPETGILSATVKTDGQWIPVKDIAIDKSILEELKLDDYIFRSYTDGKRIAILYIGYYGTAKTVGASHDPLVCFPGQGWVIASPKEGIVRLPGGGEQSVNYSVMTATKGEEKELILYWFQSHGETASGTVKQKLNTFLQKLQGKRGRNAFVRISIPIGQAGPDEAYRLAIGFLASFYTSFFDYIRI
jgi:EpsI family protein